MFIYILQDAGFNWMAIFALITFFSLFVIAVVVVWFRTPEFIHKMSHLPLEDDNASENH
mgnify:FL=1